ncbi:hypothetical protein CS0771_56860 [Catellatospora sp. IY07-71]|nr:hypothetical protein CS0771_56860 [Catellatospora sp. IY07-71]
MRWFTRKPASRFPSDMIRRLELLGRFSLDSQSAGIDSGDVWSTCVAPFMQELSAEPTAFLTDLRALIRDDQGGWATLGAAHLVWEVRGGDAVHLPAALPFLDGGIDFKLSRGLPTASLTGYEMQRLVQRRAAGG